MVSLQLLDRVEDALQGALDSDVWLLRTAGRHVVRSGGKRIRPQVLLLAYGAAGGRDLDAAVPLAAAVELLHTASLVHDDINDHSDLRRGQSTVNRLWGDHLALLAGDYIFVRLLRLIAPYDSAIVQVIADACSDVVEGETRQMLALGNTAMLEEEYLDVVRQKTAALFASCAALGGMLADAERPPVDALRTYGQHLGMAFQIRDDVLDLGDESAELGKPVHTDLRQQKMSLATIHALQHAPGAADALFGDGNGRALQVLEEAGSLEYAMGRASDYAALAKKALDALPASEERQRLSEMADWCLRRES